MLQVKGLSIQFGGLRAVDDVSFDVETATIHGLIGPNGSGKTTTLNMLSGFYKQSAGTLSLDGKDFTGSPPYMIARRGIVRTFQMAALQDERTIQENILLGAHCRSGNFIGHVFSRSLHQADLKEAEAAMATMGLSDLRYEVVKNVPIGVRHKTEIARALICKPAVMLLDEPSTGLNSAESIELQNAILAFKKAGITVLIVEHNMKLIMSICDTITVLDSGRKIAEGNPDRIRRDPRVIESYLGRQAV